MQTGDKGKRDRFLSANFILLKAPNQEAQCSLEKWYQLVGQICSKLKDKTQSYFAIKFKPLLVNNCLLDYHNTPPLEFYH